MRNLSPSSYRTRLHRLSQAAQAKTEKEVERAEHRYSEWLRSLTDEELDEELRLAELRQSIENGLVPESAWVDPFAERGTRR